MVANKVIGFILLDTVLTVHGEGFALLDRILQ